ncbi:MAG: hypothetical protein E6R03_09565 [Hyphomicrobiaceae bacterium]|nr:MAG: hypothetical protein E6R03_09565 [Hyphomicrobiaceae bacterium]
MYIQETRAVATKDSIDKLVPRGTVATSSSVGSKELLGLHPLYELEIENTGNIARVAFMPSANSTAIETLGATPLTTVTAGKEYLLTVADTTAYIPGSIIEIRQSGGTLRLIAVVQGVDQRSWVSPPSGPFTQIRLIAPFGAMDAGNVQATDTVFWAISRNDTSNHYYVGFKMADGAVRRVMPPAWAKYIHVTSTTGDTRLILHEVG